LAQSRIVQFYIGYALNFALSVERSFTMPD